MAAFAFYHAAKDNLEQRIINNPEENPNIDLNAISLTGHSLGGGLAGLVGAIHLKNAEMFANMPFELAVQNAYEYMTQTESPEEEPGAAEARFLIYGDAEPWQPLIGTNLHGYAVNSEALSGFRISQLTPDDSLDPGTLDLGSLDFGERHSMALHTLLLWEKENTTDIKWWTEVSTDLWNAYSNDDIGEAAGFSPKMLQHENTEGQKLGSAIAYSVIDEGTRPFGDTAVKALFNDANDLGYAVYDGSSEALSDAVQFDITNLIAHYAGLLAKHAVLTDDNAAAVDGIVMLHEDKESISVDLTEEKWTVGGVESDPFGLESLIDNVLGGSLYDYRYHDAIEWYADTFGLGGVGYDIFSSITFDLTGAANTIPVLETVPEKLKLIAVTSGANGRAYGNSDDLMLGSDESQAIFGGEGFDIIYGGGANDDIRGDEGADYLSGDGGSDTVQGGEGDDWIVGGDGNDDLRGDTGEDLIEGGEGNDILVGGEGYDFLYGDSGDDVFYFGAGADAFGGDGDDTFYVKGDDSYIDAGEGSDVVHVEGSTSLHYRYSTGDGIDQITTSTTWNSDNKFWFENYTSSQDWSVSLEIKSSQYLYGNPDTGYTSLICDVNLTNGGDNISIENVEFLAHHGTPTFSIDTLSTLETVGIDAFDHSYWFNYRQHIFSDFDWVV